MKSVKDKLFNNSFTAYIRAYYASPIGGRRDTGFMWDMVINAVVFMVALIIVGNFESEIIWDDSVIVNCASAEIGAILCAMWLLMGVPRRVKPSPMGLLPLSWKRRVVYDYLGNLVYTLLVLAILAVVALIWILILGLIILSFTGEWLFSIDLSYGTVTTITVSAQGQLFALFAGLFIYGTGACLSYLPGKKLRIGLTIAFPFVLELLGLLFLNCSKDVDYFMMSGHVPMQFENLPVSWLWLTFTAIFAVGITALSVWLSIKSNKPDKI